MTCTQANIKLQCAKYPSDVSPRCMLLEICSLAGLRPSLKSNLTKTWSAWKQHGWPASIHLKFSGQRGGLRKIAELAFVSLSLLLSTSSLGCGRLRAETCVPDIFSWSASKSLHTLYLYNSKRMEKFFPTNVLSVRAPAGQKTFILRVCNLFRADFHKHIRIEIVSFDYR